LFLTIYEVDCNPASLGLKDIYAFGLFIILHMYLLNTASGQTSPVDYRSQDGQKTCGDKPYSIFKKCRGSRWTAPL